MPVRTAGNCYVFLLDVLFALSQNYYSSVTKFLLLTAHMDAASTSQDGSTEPPSKRRKAPPPPATAPPAVGGGAGAGAGARAGPARSTVQKKEVTQSTPDLHLLSELGKSRSGLRFQAPAAQQYLCQQTQQSSAQQPFFHVYAIPVT